MKSFSSRKCNLRIKIRRAKYDLYKTFSKTIHVPVKVEYKASEFVLDSKGGIERDYKGDFKMKKGYLYVNVDGYELKYDLPLENRFLGGLFNEEGCLKENSMWTKLWMSMFVWILMSMISNQQLQQIM